MGQTLSEPVTNKISDQGNDKRVMYGLSSMQGWRINMEDSHTAIPCYKNTNASFFAVFDGHGGDSVAKYCGKYLHERIFQSQPFKDRRYRDALRWGNLVIDEDLRQDPSLREDTAGCTAVAALLTKDNVLYVSNAGDSRAVISTRNGKAIPLSKDHKPNDALETARIKQAGGYVEFKRVNGSLALSRAIGDFGFKSNTQLPPEKQAVTADPDITEHEMTDLDEFMVLACDGIWDCLRNQEVIDYIRHALTLKKTLQTICEELMDFCLAESGDMTGIGCDNMTIIIVAFLRKRTTDQWYEWMASKQVADPPKRRTPKLPPTVLGARQQQQQQSSTSPPPKTELAAINSPPTIKNHSIGSMTASTTSTTSTTTSTST
ncbi:phosphatase 2C-like domain-containing protein [Halteromyces radiatus]|uniref:phosphatase 2C-like domain-containing protein n=1 Tax=Halteromyces radiatus TaxID=101107 RepID=UPI00221E7142|nr:phosphatase 2C-like domain-containing protein [Halteromyces radiatus]KAI8099211.1 phosphatase 2C-like domain-containing protein [Halteromyces radiatus]